MMKKCVYAVMSLLVIALLTAFFLPDHTEGKGEKRFFGAMSALFKGEEAAKETDDGFSLKVYLTKDKKIKTIPLEEYVAGVVASEMPMTYHREALNAQAVAARSYAVFKSNLYSGEGCASHPGADVCSSSGCCQGYKPPDDDEYKNAIRAARETENAIALFRNHPIRAQCHGRSNAVIISCPQGKAFGAGCFDLCELCDIRGCFLDPGNIGELRQSVVYGYRNIHARA